MPRHAHEYANVTAVISGEMVETTDTSEHSGRSCSVLLKPAGTEHCNVVPSRKGAITISIQIDAASALGREISRHGWSWHEDPAAARAALALYTATSDIEARAWDLIAIATSRAMRAAPPPWLTEVLATLERRFDEPIRFADIARDAGLHPVYVSRAFHRVMGVSMGDHLRALRLRHARHLLSTSDKSVASISIASGFADPSHLSRTFTEAHAITPRRFRRMISAG